jgi:hypothetical protein
MRKPHRGLRAPPDAVPQAPAYQPTKPRRASFTTFLWEAV